MLLIYHVLTLIFYPLLILLIYFRKIMKKEDSIRFKEKIFFWNFNVSKEQNSKIIWFHAASIGELKSIIPLIDRLNNENENLAFLITTVTLSSGNLAKEIFKDKNNVHHRFFPLDIKFLIEKFVLMWKPDAVIIVETEIWPNLISVIKKNKIPLAIINARLTEKTFKRWMFFSKAAKNIFNSFDLCLTANQETKKFLQELNARNIYFFGNIKLIGKINKDFSDDINIHFLSNNLIWCALSTHNTEEKLCLEAHIELKKKYSNIKTVIAPRHTNRVKKIKKLCDDLNLKSQILSKDDKILNISEIIIINSFGNIDKFLKYSNSVFIGKSTIKKLEKVGGQNPIDAAKLGCKIYHGPYVYNFKEIYSILQENNVSKLIVNSKELTNNLINDLDGEKHKNENFSRIMDNLGKTTLLETMKMINKFLFNETKKT